MRLDKLDEMIEYLLIKSGIPKEVKFKIAYDFDKGEFIFTFINSKSEKINLNISKNTLNDLPNDEIRIKYLIHIFNMAKNALYKINKED